MTTINVISLMEQLNRGHTAKLIDHSEDRLSILARDIATFLEEWDLLECADSFEYGTYSFNALVEKTKNELINNPSDVLEYFETRKTRSQEKQDKIKSITERIKTIV